MRPGRVGLRLLTQKTKGKTGAKMAKRTTSLVESAILGTSASSVAVVLLTFISGVLIARVLGPEARGEYGTALLVAQTAAAIGALSFFDASILIGRRSERSLSDAMPTLIFAAVAICLFSSALSMGVLSQFQFLFKHVPHGVVYVFTTLIIFANAVTQLFSAVDRSDMRFFGINFARVSSPAAYSLMLLVAWLVLGNGIVLGLVLFLFLASKLPSFVYWIVSYRRAFRGRISWEFAREALTMGLRLHPAFLLTLIAGQFDRIFAVGVWPQDVLGNYFVAYSAVGAGYGVVTSALTMVMFPYLAGVATEHRQARIAQALRLALLLVLATAVGGTLVLPVLIPLLYGAEFMMAVGFSLGLLFALGPGPLRVLVLEAGRSRGLGRPSVEMALVSLAVMVLGYLLTGYTSPRALIAAFGLANLASTIAGARHLISLGDIRLDRSLIPGPADVRFVFDLVGRLRGNGK